MPAYFIVFVEKPADHAEIDEYRRIAMPSLMNREVEFLTRPGLEVLTMEGDEVDVVVTLKFPTVEAARDWYNCETYQTAVKHRKGTAKSRAVIVQGL